MVRRNGNDSVADDAGPEDGDVYEIDIEDEAADADKAMREAVEAVEARERDHVQDPDLDASDELDESGGSEVFVEAEELVAEGPLEELQREFAELRERSVRTLADYENFRRRVERERSDQRRYAAAEALGSFLTVIDNLERALRAEGSAEDLRVGVEMIHRQMLDLLERFGASQVPALGERFDPSVHEAVARDEDESVDAPTVLEEYQRGYRIHDRLLRPAMVRVGVPVGRGGEPSRGVGEGEES
jgi:molecular chaperone GrpE